MAFGQPKQSKACLFYLCNRSIL